MSLCLSVSVHVYMCAVCFVVENVCYCIQDANERLKPVPSIPGDRETLLRLLDRRQQEIDRLTGKPCNHYYRSVSYALLGVSVYMCTVSLSCIDEWRNMLNKLEKANAEKSNTQSKLDEIILQDSSAKVFIYYFIHISIYTQVFVYNCVHACVCLWRSEKRRY